MRLICRVVATTYTDLKGQKIEVVATGDTDLKGQKSGIVAIGGTVLKGEMLQIVATGETDLKGRKSEVVASGETDLEVREEITSVRILVRTVEESNGAEAWRLIHSRYAPDTQNRQCALMQKTMMPAKLWCHHAEGFESGWVRVSETALADAVKDLHNLMKWREKERHEEKRD